MSSYDKDTPARPRRVEVRLADDEHAALVALAADLRCSISSAARRAILSARAEDLKPAQWRTWQPPAKRGTR